MGKGERGRRKDRERVGEGGRKKGKGGGERKGGEGGRVGRKKR